MAETCFGSNGAGFGAFTFHAHLHGTDECDSRGLPLTPNSIIMTGNFQKLKAISHPNLCKYLDLIKCPSEERMMCVSEYYQDNLENHISTGEYSSGDCFSKMAYELLSGIGHLHKRNILVRNLSSSTVLLTKEGQMKLFNYGFYHLTSNGDSVGFPVGSPRYLAPEIILGLKPVKRESVTVTTKSDIWSCGIILLELVMKSHIYPDLFLKNGLPALFSRIIRLVKSEQTNSQSPLQILLETHSIMIEAIDKNILSILNDMLSCLPSKRRSVPELLDSPLLKECRTSQSKIQVAIRRDPFKKNGFRASKIPDPMPTPIAAIQVDAVLNQDHLNSWSIKDVYYLWSLAGGDVKAELSKHGLIKSRTPILTLPLLVSKEGAEFGMDETAMNLFDDRIVALPLTQLRWRLQGMTVEDYYPLLNNPEIANKAKRQSLKKAQSHSVVEAAKLPLAIKEGDIEYQFHRVVLFRQLLEAYPYTREMIVNESLSDICPYYRGPVWAAILNVKGDILTQYTAIDKDTETSTDRQIAVDIPRCHQYDFLLASKQGHIKFERVLKAWVASHSNLVYWQGLDSLCAPFIALNFDNEALAYSCLCAFIEKFLKDFFKKKNSELMQEYLAVFSHMIAFHDPELFTHLDKNMFYPDLYAIPWFLTMFTHVFPLKKIYHLWDTLLLGNPSFPLFAGLSILSHLRNELFATSDFSECITMFSDLPDIGIEQCTRDAVHKYQITPSSLCVREYDSQPIQHPSIPNRTRKKPLGYQKLKEYCSPEISAHDLITLCRLDCIEYKGIEKIPVKDPNNPLLWRKLETTPTKGMEAVVLDMRSEEEFRIQRIPNSINTPISKESVLTCIGNNEGNVATLLTEGTIRQLDEANKGKIIIIVGNNKEDPDMMTAHTFARCLVQSNYRYVSVVQGGASLLNKLGLFVTTR